MLCKMRPPSGRCFALMPETFVPQDIIQALLVGIAKIAPEAALSALLADVLSEPGNWDTTLVGLQALLVILFEGPKQSSRRAGADSELVMAQQLQWNCFADAPAMLRQLHISQHDAQISFFALFESV